MNKTLQIFAISLIWIGFDQAMSNAQSLAPGARTGGTVVRVGERTDVKNLILVSQPWLTTGMRAEAKSSDHPVEHL
jgi:hypothetical protein